MQRGKSVRVGVIGCGFYAQNHLNAWTDLQSRGAELVAVCDLDPDRARKAGETFGASWYTDADQMLDAGAIDLLDITTQMASHRALAAKAAERGIAAIVQKPFAPSLDDCIAIVEAAERHGAWLAVHENFRFGTAMRRVKEVLKAGTIGTPDWARISFRTNYDIYSGQPYLMEEDRLAILDTGTHVLDLARYFLGEVDHLSCETQRRNPNIKAEDTATMMLRHSSGAVSVVETTYQAHRIPDAFPATLLEIEGDAGSIIVSHDEQMTVTTRGQSTSESIGSPLLPWTSHPWHISQEAVLHANAHFLDCFFQGVAADTSGRDNLKTFALVEAAYLAAESGQIVYPSIN